LQERRSIAEEPSIGSSFASLRNEWAGLWIITIFYKLSIGFYAINLGLAQTLKLKDYKFLTFPLGIIVVTNSLILSPNIVYLNTYVEKTFTPFASTFGLFIPLILLVVATFQKRLSSR
jgi:spore germination protein KB